MITNINITEKNNSLLYYFHELILGKYDDGEISNFFIKSNDITKEEIFIVTESNDEESIIDFVKDSIPNIVNMQNISDKDINYEPTNFNILVLQLTKNENNSLEIKTLGIMEWLISKMMFDLNVNNVNTLGNYLTDKTYNLYVANVDNIKKNFKDIINDENFKEILENEEF